MGRIYLSPPHMGPEERRLLLEAFDSNWIAPLGPHVDAFEREFADTVGVPHAAALSSGTAALHLALRLLGVGPGDAVLCSSFTFAASAFAIRYLGAEPVFIDSDAASWNMDPGLLTEELEACAKRGRMPKAAIVVDLYGQCADYEPLLAACRKHGVPVIEDAAEALGATHRDRLAGSLGDVGVFSFNGNKIITTSSGGMLVSRNSEWIAKARFWASQARDPAPHYQHSEIGHNYRLSNLLAAVGRGQLRILSERLKARRRNYDFYKRELGGIVDRPSTITSTSRGGFDGIAFMPEAPFGRMSCWLTCMTIDPEKSGGVTREDVRLALEKENIESRPLWKPMHLQPVFRDCRVVGGAVSEALFRDGLCLPSGSSLCGNDLERIVETIQRVFTTVRKK
jgi:dTDP-4-amino-4,6-dideoxygalactose transaminase